MNILHFTGIRFLPFLISGILFGYYADTPWYIPFILSLTAASVLAMLRSRIPEYFLRTFPLKCLRSRACLPVRQAVRSIFFRRRRQKDAAPVPSAGETAFSRLRPSRQTLSGITVLAAVFLTGWLSLTLHTAKNQPGHYSRYGSTNAADTIAFRIRKTLEPTSLYHRYQIAVFRINTKKATGTLLLNIRKDSAFRPLKINDRFVAKAALHRVMSPLNPHQFSYKSYLEKQNIYHQLYLQFGELYPLPDAGIPSLQSMAEWLRETLVQALEQHFRDNELGVINALLLGQRRDIPDQLYSSYANAGAVHILAVSGLHVGIMLLIFNFLLKPLTHFRHGKKLKLLLVVLLLWAFALVAGLSASVVRAVTMFSFVAWALHIKRTVNTYNILAVSMLFLLLVNPLFLFNVGFQLSYSAVFAIVALQPLLYKLWKPRWKTADFFWKITTVTLAAQCGVAPLSLYYFHQFPGLFFVSNLVIVPALGLILGLGILVMLLALLHSLPPWLATGYGYIIRQMNNFVQWVAAREAFVFRDISFDGMLLFTSCFALISAILMLKKPGFPKVALFLTAVLALQATLIVNRYTTVTTRRFIIFHKNGETVIGQQEGAAMLLYASDEKLVTDPLIKNYAIAERIGQIHKNELRNVYTIREKTLLRIDSLGVYNIPRFQPRYVLLCNDPRINLDRLITEVRPELIIADGSNYKSYIQRWKASCKAKHIPFHATAEKGAFIISD